MDKLGFVSAGELWTGARLLDVKGDLLNIEDMRLELVGKPVTVYNFQVEEFHTYYAGAVSVLVHNADYPEDVKGIQEKPHGGTEQKPLEGGTGTQSVGNPVAVEGRGNTGKTIPDTLNEQMAMHKVQSNPLEGATKVPLDMTDPRWPASEGWVKMQTVVQNADGTKITIHFLYNVMTDAFDDFKFK